MHLFKRRKQLRKLAEAEARGETFWTPDFEDRVRVKILQAYRRHVPAFEDSIKKAHEFIIEDEGVLTLTNTRSPSEDLFNHYGKCSTDDYASLVEALIVGAVSVPYSYGYGPDLNGFVEDVNRIFEEHRVSWEIVGPEMVPFESKEMHTSVVAPVLRLLSGRSGWEAVEAAYQDALEELSKREAGDAITDAGRALEEALGALGCVGNTLMRRYAVAVEKGLMRSADRKLIDWIAGARGNLSDAHAGDEGEHSEAWLVVHVVGALILRLVP